MTYLRFLGAAVCSAAILAGALWLATQDSASLAAPIVRDEGPNAEVSAPTRAAAEPALAPSNSAGASVREAAIEDVEATEEAGAVATEDAPEVGEVATTFLEVRVIDEEALPIAHAKITLSVPVGDAGATFQKSAFSAASGNASLAHLPDAAGSTLLVSAEGHLSRSLDASGLLGTYAEIVLQRQANTVRIHGSVLTADGRPAGAARVFIGETETRALKDGSFAFQVSKLIDFGATPLIAVQRNVQPAIVYLADLSEVTSLDRPVELVLGGATKSISGRLVDAMGEPLAGCTVSLQSGTPDGRGGVLEASVDLGQRSQRSDANGRFQIRGLLDRAYELAVHRGGASGGRRGGESKSARPRGQADATDSQSDRRPDAQVAGPFEAGQGQIEIVVR